MAEKRKFSSRRDTPGQSVFKQDLFLLSVPTGSTSNPGTDRVLATDKDGRVVSVIGGSGGGGSNGTSGSSGGSVTSGTSGTSGTAGLSKTSGSAGAAGTSGST